MAKNGGSYALLRRRAGVFFLFCASHGLIMCAQGANNASFVSQSVSAAMTAGQSYGVSVTMQNTGTGTWTKAAGYKLGSQYPQDNALWAGSSRINLADADAIAPGQQKTFSFNITAPVVPGTYYFQWKLVQEGVEWFGGVSQLVVVTVSAPDIVSGPGAAAAVTQTGFGSNSVAFWQIPAQINLFAGRITQDGGATWSLALGTMNWAANTITNLRPVLTPPVAIPEGKTITTAYDPSVAFFSNEFWAAFECHGTGFSGTASTCMGPLDINGVIDISRTYVAILGTSYLSDGLLHSASVPKLFNHQNRLYLYWTAVNMDAVSPNTWHNITSWGVELEQEAGGLRRLWPKGAGGPIASNNPLAVEVWGLGADNRSDTVADMFQVLTDGQYVYATGARGGSGSGGADRCLTPLNSSAGCYRLSMARSNTPLGTHIFNQTVAGDGQFPSNPHEYGRIIFLPDGSSRIMGQFLSASPAQQDAYTIPIGFQSLPIPNGSLSSLFVGNGAQFVSQSVPASMTAGQSYNVSVTMKNMGTNTWTKSAGYKLGSQNPADNSLWLGSSNRVYLADADAVATGQQKTFSFSVTAPAAPGTYNFQWKMVQEGVAWFGGLSTNVSVTVQIAADTQPPSVPQGLSASAASSSQINLSWAVSTDNIGVSGYRIYRNGSQIATTAATSFQNSGLSPSTAYSYAVAAYDAAGNVSSQSSAASATTAAVPDVTPPSVPQGLTATAASSSQINLNWTASTDNVAVSGYRIYRNGVELTATPATSFQDTGRSPSTAYSYTVSAYDAAGNLSSRSSAASAATPSADQVPKGYHESSDCGASLGWACDPDNYAQSLQVYLYADGPAGQGIFLGSETASAAREAAVGAECGGHTAHGFTFPTPASVKDGASHTLYAYAINLNAGGNPLLTGSPKTITCAAPGDVASPSIPQGLAATAASSSQINLSWTASTDNVAVSGYRIYRNGSQIATTAATSFQSIGLSSSTIYSYTVSAYDAAGNVSAQSSAVSAATDAAADATVPSVPQGLTATAASSSQINLSWTASTDNVAVSGYRIYRNGLLIDSTASTSFQDTGRSPSTVYTYTVAAYDVAGNVSAQSSSASAGTPASTDTVAPSIPQALTAAPASPSQINLSWSASSDNVGVSGYRVYRGGSLVNTTQFTYFQDTGRSPSTVYTYTVAAYDVAGNVSAQSSSASAGTPASADAAAPSIPQGLTATAASFSQVNLSWTASTDNVAVSGYRVYRNGAQITATASTSFQDAGRSPSTAYAYAVAAYDAAGNLSALSSAASASTPAEPDTAAPEPSMTAPRNGAAVSGTIAVSAGASDNVGVSHVEFYSNGILINTLAAAPYAFTLDTTLGANGNHTFQAKAVDAAGNSSWSQAAGVTVSNWRTSEVAAISTIAASASAIVTSTPTASRDISVTIPAGSFAGQVVINLKILHDMPPPHPVANSDLNSTGIGMEIRVAPTVQPANYATIEISYTDAEVARLDRSKLLLARYDEGSAAWLPLESISYPAQNKVTARTAHFSLFQVMSPAAAVDLDDIRIYPNPFYPSRGQARVTIDGLPEGTKVKIYTIKGELLWDITVPAMGTVAWNGRNKSGRAVASGLYLVYFEQGGNKKIKKVSVIR